MNLIVWKLQQHSVTHLLKYKNLGRQILRSCHKLFQAVFPGKPFYWLLKVYRITECICWKRLQRSCSPTLNPALTFGWHSVCVTALSVILFSTITLVETKIISHQFIYQKIFWRLLLNRFLYCCFHRSEKNYLIPLTSTYLHYQSVLLTNL